MRASRWPSRGSWKYVMVPKVSPVGRKTSSTGLSKPPPDTHSSPVPSGRTRQMREAFPWNSRPSLALMSYPCRPSVRYSQPSGPKKGPWRLAAFDERCQPVTMTSRWSATPSPSVSVKRIRSGGAATYKLPRYHTAPAGSVSLSAKTVLRS